MAEDVLEETFVLALISPLSSPCLPGAWGRIPFPPVFALHGYNSSPWIGLFRGSLDLQSLGVSLGNWPGAVGWSFPPCGLGAPGWGSQGRVGVPVGWEPSNSCGRAVKNPQSWDLHYNLLFLYVQAFLNFPVRLILDSQNNGVFLFVCFLIINQIWFFWHERLWKWSNCTVCSSVCRPY